MSIKAEAKPSFYYKKNYSSFTLDSVQKLSGTGKPSCSPFPNQILRAAGDAWASLKEKLNE